MGYILAALKVIGSLLNIYTTRNKYIRERKKAALGEVVDGIKKKDPSLITSGFDRIHRL